MSLGARRNTHLRRGIALACLAYLGGVAHALLGQPHECSDNWTGLEVLKVVGGFIVLMAIGFAAGLEEGKASGEIA